MSIIAREMMLNVMMLFRQGSRARGDAGFVTSARDYVSNPASEKVPAKHSSSLQTRHRHQPTSVFIMPRAIAGESRHPEHNAKPGLQHRAILYRQSRSSTSTWTGFLPYDGTTD